MRRPDALWPKWVGIQNIKCALSGLRHMEAESLLQMIKKGFHFTSKALFVLKIFKFLSWLFCHVAQRLA